jgi:glycosyltransferase involved in cell wall biosynthesis
MRILQLIDSLEAGGAERMAVNYANALVNSVSFSGIVVTRKEGALLNEINPKVSYLFLNKKKTIDFGALFRLKKYVNNHKIQIVHAHGTSFFLAFLLKLFYPKIKIIWHEHFGDRAKQSKRDNVILIFCSLFFSAVFVVNHQLEAWVKKNLFAKKVSFIPNFTTLNKNVKKATFLKGEDGKRIICLANLKSPKNHLALLKAFNSLKLNDLLWSLHLVGRDYNDSYSLELKDFISKNNLENCVFIYGSQNDIQPILSQATIGVLASTAEGFPVTLLEYGLAKLGVISTNVGYCSEIVRDNFTGLLFDPFDESQLQKQLCKLVHDTNLIHSFGLSLSEYVLENYTQEKVIALLLSKYKELHNFTK